MKSISNHIKTRTPTQVRSHMQKYLAKQKRKENSDVQQLDQTPN